MAVSQVVARIDALALERGWRRWIVPFAPEAGLYRISSQEQGVVLRTTQPVPLDTAIRALEG